jgi:HD-GYP domain-containing protein (c-di-GMP phosphodiesterase class II)/predicted DNA-binding protein (UPF0251 family)
MDVSSPSKLRLTDLLCGLSIVADMGFGLTPGQAMRSCLMATALARKLDLSESQVADAFYTALLMHIGCVSMSHETSVLFGNELVVTRAVSMTNLADPEDFVVTLIPEITKGMNPSESQRLASAVVVSGPTFGQLYDTASTEVARVTARRIGLPQSTQRCLYEVAESFDGGGAPVGLKGDEISPASRIVRLAADAAVFNDLGDADVIVEALKKRAGGTLDPELVDAFTRNASDLVAEASASDPRDRVLEVEPQPVAWRDEGQLLEVAAAFGDIADLKAPFMQQHASRVASLSASAANRCGLDDSSTVRLRIAALLHNIGRVGVSNVVWEKPGALSIAEWELVRMHPYHSERILASSRTLEPTARVAGMHHERLDGSGYHRGSTGADIPMPARILAAADAFEAMTHDRPYRRALSPEEARDQLRADARAGKFDGDAVAAVLEGAGQGRTRASDLRPAGLSDREVEVLRLVAAGHSNPEIARLLHVSRRTAEHHVQHIYAKIGVATRPGAALFALQHDLLG